MGASLCLGPRKGGGVLGISAEILWKAQLIVVLTGSTANQKDPRPHNHSQQLLLEPGERGFLEVRDVGSSFAVMTS